MTINIPELQDIKDQQAIILALLEQIQEELRASSPDKPEDLLKPSQAQGYLKKLCGKGSRSAVSNLLKEFPFVMKPQTKEGMSSFHYFRGAWVECAIQKGWLKEYPNQAFAEFSKANFNQVKLKVV
jgi:hypothetical protein